MKKTLIITTGIILILLVLGVWMYLLFFGTPKDGVAVFSNLGMKSVAQRSSSTMAMGDNMAPTALPAAETPITQLSTADALRQVTLRPIAGFGFVGSSTILRYIERGTGYIYEIDPQAGTEMRLSGTTIPKVVDGYFSPSGKTVALVAESEGSQTIYIGDITPAEENVEFYTLPRGATEPGFVSDTALRYIVPTNIGSEGYELNLTTGAALRIFSMPLQEVSMIWSDETYFYPKPASQFEGSLYKVRPTLEPVLPAHNALVAGISSDHYLSSYSQNGMLTSHSQQKADASEVRPLTVLFIPEKCTVSASTTLWCASELGQKDDSFLEAWYRGDMQSADTLWKINPRTGQSKSVVNPLTTAGRVVDVDRIMVDSSGAMAVFRNKIDNALWLYDTQN